MPRPKKIRKINNPPKIKGFRPIGQLSRKNPVVINFEEYEAIRLCDYELMDQLAASKIMEVSRPTFTRIYESARRKVASAFVDSKSIVFEGGKVNFDNEWFNCLTCGAFFNNPGANTSLTSCPLCGSSHFQNSDLVGLSCPEESQTQTDLTC